MGTGVKLGADGLQTDHPEKLIKYLKDQGEKDNAIPYMHESLFKIFNLNDTFPQIAQINADLNAFFI